MKVQEMSMNKDMVLEKHIFQMVIHMKGCMKMDRDTERLTINKINICQLKVSFSKSSISFSFKIKLYFWYFAKQKSVEDQSSAVLHEKFIAEIKILN